MIPTKAQALEALDSLDDYARMGVPGGVNAFGPVECLRQYIERRKSKPAKAPSDRGGIPAAREVNRRALAHCANALAECQSLTSAALHESAVKAGILLHAQNPLGRLVQLLSCDPRFCARRGIGWSLSTPPRTSSGALEEAT